ncbi:MAG: hypothetical protein WCD69_21865 [Xanthobacteraceae bacterium]
MNYRVRPISVPVGIRATSNACISISLFRRSSEFSEENTENNFSEQGILSDPGGSIFGLPLKSWISKHQGQSGGTKRAMHNANLAHILIVASASGVGAHIKKE